MKLSMILEFGKERGACRGVLLCLCFPNAVVDTTIRGSLKSGGAKTAYRVPQGSVGKQENVMKRIAALFVLSILCWPLAARSQSAAAPQAAGRKKRVAVFDFDYATV